MLVSTRVNFASQLSNCSSDVSREKFILFLTPLFPGLGCRLCIHVTDSVEWKIACLQSKFIIICYKVLE